MQIVSKIVAVAALRDVLKAIENAGREPDYWERMHLLRGISYLFTESYDFAIGQAAMAVAPHHEWAPADSLFETASTRRFDTAALWKELELVAREPPRRSGTSSVVDASREPGAIDAIEPR